METALSRTLIIALAATVGSCSSVPRKETRAQVPLTWNEYWAAHGITNPPPRDFLEGKFGGTIQNLSNGKLSDATVRKWVVADLRRARGDMWAGEHLRLDIVNSGLLGPRGLNGTDAYIERELAKGVARLEAAGASETVTVAVVDVEEIFKKTNSAGEVPKFAIVSVFRATEKGTNRIFKDGRTEAIESQEKAGALWWQIDTGWLVDDATLGPFWYQEHGWSCVPNDGSDTGEVCGLVRP